MSTRTEAERVAEKVREVYGCQCRVHETYGMGSVIVVDPEDGALLPAVVDGVPIWTWL